MEVLKKYDLRSGQSKQLLCFLDKEAINSRGLDRTEKNRLKRQSWLLRNLKWKDQSDLKRAREKEAKNPKSLGREMCWEQGWGHRCEQGNWCPWRLGGRLGGWQRMWAKWQGPYIFKSWTPCVGNRKSQASFPHRNHEAKILGTVNFLLQF